MHFPSAFTKFFAYLYNRNFIDVVFKGVHIECGTRKRVAKRWTVGVGRGAGAGNHNIAGAQSCCSGISSGGSGLFAFVGGVSTVFNHCRAVPLVCIKLIDSVPKLACWLSKKKKKR